MELGNHDFKNCHQWVKESELGSAVAHKQLVAW